MSRAWVRQLLELLEREPCVLVTLRQNKGSSPRESGARMIVTEDGFQGSVGGGNLEFQAIATAREMLQKIRGHRAAPTTPSEGPVGAALWPRLEPYGLGPALNQCCGGSVDLLFEPLQPPAPDWLAKLAAALDHGDPAVLASAVEGESADHHLALPVGRESELPEPLRAPVRALLNGSGTSVEVVNADGRDWWLQRIAADRRRLLLFGAGHVGKAVVRALADLPFEVRWLDGREDAFPDTVPANVTLVHTDEMLDEVANAAPGTIFIVMTHSHDLDEEICHAVLSRGDFEFLGLIGSISKHRRFVHRLKKRGISEADLKRLICPIGLAGIPGKEPATIALSLAAQLMSQPRDG